MGDYRSEVDEAAAERRSGDGSATMPARLLERLIGRPPETWTSEDLADVVRAHGVRLVSLMHIGGDGWLKTLDFVPRSLSHLHDILEGGERADGSSLFAGFGLEAGASDILLRPRIGSAFLNPFTSNPSLVLLCSHAGRDGKPLSVSPDVILRRSYERLHRLSGVDLWALGEVEYFLGKPAGEGDVYGADERGYHASSPFVFGEALRRRALTILADIGVPIKYGHSEVGYIAPSDADKMIWEQHEVELMLAPLPEAADSVSLTQWVLRNLAHEQSMRCSFDPIIRAGHAGSGLHFHFSPMVNGRQAGRSQNGELLCGPGRWLVAGLVLFGAALMAFGNRNAGSFIRLSQAKEAPRSITWGEYDRHALVRLPITATTGSGRLISPPTIEFRLPDGSAHPYLLLAGVAQAMQTMSSTSGLDEVLDRTSSTNARVDPAGDPELPRSFQEIADVLEAHRTIFEQDDVFPPALIDHQLRLMRS